MIFDNRYLTISIFIFAKNSITKLHWMFLFYPWCSVKITLKEKVKQIKPKTYRLIFLIIFFLARGKIFPDEIIDGQTVISKHPSNYNLRLNLFYDGNEKVTFKSTFSGVGGFSAECVCGYSRGRGSSYTTFTSIHYTLPSHTVW